MDGRTKNRLEPANRPDAARSKLRSHRARRVETTTFDLLTSNVCIFIQLSITSLSVTSLSMMSLSTGVVW